MTNNTYDGRAVGLLNSAVQIESPQRGMSRIIPTNWKLRVHIHWIPPNINYDLYGKGIQIWNIDTFILEDIITSSNEVFLDFETDIAIGDWLLRNSS